MITEELINSVTISAVVGHPSFLPMTIKAMEYSIKDIPFKHIQILSCIEFNHSQIKYIPIESMTYPQYNDFMIREFNNFIDSNFVITIQDDGFIINPNSWSNEFLEYDYIGALWPHSIHRVGNGGFSLRSKRLLDLVPYNCDRYLSNAEDVIICQKCRPHLEKQGIQFAPPQIAAKFSIEAMVPETHGQNPNQRHSITSFGFHGKYHDAINFLKEMQL
jgi:hypothetical protein